MNLLRLRVYLKSLIVFADHKMMCTRSY